MSIVDDVVRTQILFYIHSLDLVFCELLSGGTTISTEKDIEKHKND